MEASFRGLQTPEAATIPGTQATLATSFRFTIGRRHAGQGNGVEASFGIVDGTVQSTVQEKVCPYWHRPVFGFRGGLASTVDGTEKEPLHMSPSSVDGKKKKI